MRRMHPTNNRSPGSKVVAHHSHFSNDNNNDKEKNVQITDLLAVLAHHSNFSNDAAMYRILKPPEDLCDNIYPPKEKSRMEINTHYLFLNAKNI